jgi:hypothetical protein
MSSRNRKSKNKNSKNSSPSDAARIHGQREPSWEMQNLRAQKVPKSTLLSLPKQVGLAGVLPDRFVTRLRYWKQGSNTLAIASVASARFRPTGAFDIDPVLASTAMPGFAELSTLYNQYRVTYSKACLEVTNPSLLTPFEAVLAPQNIDPGPSPSAGYIASLRLQPYAAAQSVNTSGGPMTRLHNAMSTEKIFGSEQVYYDDAYASTVSAVPVNNWFWVIGFTTANLIPTNSIQWTITIDVTIEFFDRVYLFQ